jgi:hypothetical protein
MSWRFRRYRSRTAYSCGRTAVGGSTPRALSSPRRWVRRGGATLDGWDGGRAGGEGGGGGDTRAGGADAKGLGLKEARTPPAPLAGRPPGRLHLAHCLGGSFAAGVAAAQHCHRPLEQQPHPSACRLLRSRPDAPACRGARRGRGGGGRGRWGHRPRPRPVGLEDRSDRGGCSGRRRGAAGPGRHSRAHPPVGFRVEHWGPLCQASLITNSGPGLRGRADAMGGCRLAQGARLLWQVSRARAPFAGLGPSPQTSRPRARPRDPAR